MRKMRRNWMYLFSAIAVTAGVSVVTANPALAYSPGTATAYKPTYNASTGGYDWHCSYHGWRSDAKVIWKCSLHEIFLSDGGWENEVITSHTGSWTPGSTSHTTATYLHKLNSGEGELCTEAYAYSVDGGVDVTKCDS